MSQVTFVPRRTIGAWTVYERRPKPKGVSKYTTGTGQLFDYKNFARYAPAVRWIKKQRDNEQMYQAVIVKPV